jgi:hypothetical protein
MLPSTSTAGHEIIFFERADPGLGLGLFLFPAANGEKRGDSSVSDCGLLRLDMWVMVEPFGHRQNTIIILFSILIVLIGLHMG